MLPRKGICFTLFIAIAGITCYAAAHNLQNPDSAHPQPSGRYTAQQMIERSPPIFRALLPRQHNVRLTAYSNTATDEDGKRHSCWNIECADAEDRLLASASFNADTGTVCKVVHNGLLHTANYQQVARPQPVSRREAITASRCWLRTLGGDSGWRVTGATRHGGSAWDIRLISARGSAFLIIDSSPTTLLFAEISDPTLARSGGP